MLATVVDLNSWKDEACSVLLMGLTGKRLMENNGYFEELNVLENWFPLFEVKFFLNLNFL
jgi:hypothetical protein